MSHTYVGGLLVHHKLYRVPDLLGKDAFIAYMKQNYGVNVIIEEIPDDMHPDDVPEDYFDVVVPMEENAEESTHEKNTEEGTHENNLFDR